MAAFVIASMMGGTPLIYSSQEIAYPQSLSFFDYRLMDWDSNPAYLSEYKQLMKIYQSSASLREGNLKTYGTGKVASFYRANGEKRLFVVVNTADELLTIKTPIERAGERMKNLLNNEEITLPATLTLEAYQYYIWEKE